MDKETTLAPDGAKTFLLTPHQSIILTRDMSPGAGIIPVWRHRVDKHTGGVAFYQIK